MQAVTQTDLRANIKNLLDDVSLNNDTVIVTRSNRENVVVISESEYNSWLETNYLLSTEANRNALADSIASVKRGEGKVITPEEWEQMNG